VSFISIEQPKFVYYLLAVYWCQNFLRSFTNLMLVRFLALLEQAMGLKLALLGQVLGLGLILLELSLERKLSSP
jgi:hypothetical protein